MIATTMSAPCQTERPPSPDASQSAPRSAPSNAHQEQVPGPPIVFDYFRCKPRQRAVYSRGVHNVRLELEVHLLSRQIVSRGEYNMRRGHPQVIHLRSVPRKLLVFTN